MVECRFSNPDHEQAWNDYYTTRKLAEVLAVPGFRTSQRYRRKDGTTAAYIAIHTVDNLEVLTGGAYSAGGGGSFDPSFQPFITDWRRTLFAGLDEAPAVRLDQRLLVVDGSEPAGLPAGVHLTWLTIAGLDTSVNRRGLAVLDSELSREVEMGGAAGKVRIFTPIMEQRRELPGKYAGSNR